MSSKSDLMKHQRRWAASAGVPADSRGYVQAVDENLFQPLSESTRLAFERGSGSELQDTDSKPAKMRALHSSSALAVNFFDRWVGIDASPLCNALHLRAEISSIAFEGQCPTGLGGIPPNLDVLLELTDSHVIGIESKFSEWLTKKTKNKGSFKSKYFDTDVGRWSALGLTRAQELAEQIHTGEIYFDYLDAPQLLKHALGLATQFGQNFSLEYVYLDWPGPESEIHRAETDRFSSSVDESLRFRAYSYNELLGFLADTGSVDGDYISYLRERYMVTVDRARSSSGSS